MVNGNRPPARIENDRSPDGKLKSHLEWPKVSKKCNTNLIGQCEAPHTWLLQERCRDAAVHFSNLGGAEGGALFFGLQCE